MNSCTCAFELAGGSSGWQAPEQLQMLHGGQAVRQTPAVDEFSMGLLLHFCLTGGRHPFGEGVERDSNIMQVGIECAWAHSWGLCGSHLQYQSVCTSLFSFPAGHTPLLFDIYTCISTYGTSNLCAPMCMCMCDHMRSAHSLP